MNSDHQTLAQVEEEIKKNLDKKVCLLLMSGGVDSSTSLILLQKQNYFVIGVHLDYGDTYKTGKKNKCCNLDDLVDAKKIAEKFSTPFFNLNFKEKFRKEIVEKFIEKKSKGEFFNPCTFCHKKIKYGKLLELAKKYKTKIASGYYCKVKDGKLLIPKDKKKDQTFSLILDLKKDDLSFLEFPLGNLLKSEVRKIAEEADLPIFSKRDSMGLCFVGEKNTKDFLKNYGKNKKGELFFRDGKKTEKIGKHDGIGLYEVGENFGFNKKINGETKPLFVFRKKNFLNQIFLAEKSFLTSDLFSSEIFNLISENLTGELLIRYNSNEAGVFGTAKLRDGKLFIKLKKEISPLVPNQVFLLSKEGEYFGGGVIGEIF